MIKLFLILLFISSCAMKPTRQAQELFNDHENIPPEAMVQNVPLIKQAAYFCGPASLATIFQFKGFVDTPKDLAPQLMTDKSKGTYPEDMMGAVRRRRLIAFEVKNLKNLIMEVSSGSPVIVFQNLGLDAAPMWHYSVVVGYNLPKKTLTIHDGQKIATVSFYDFEWAWEKGGYWAMIALAPGELASSGDDLEHTKAASELEKLNFMSEAEKSYEAILNKWPASLAALIGISNIRYAQKKYEESSRSLKMATREHPQSAHAWHNLAIVQEHLKQKKEAKESAQEALRLASDEQKKQFQESLKSLLK